jgi:hypothetical protein
MSPLQSAALVAFDIAFVEAAVLKFSLNFHSIWLAIFISSCLFHLIAMIGLRKAEKNTPSYDLWKDTIILSLVFLASSMIEINTAKAGILIIISINWILTYFIFQWDHYDFSLFRLKSSKNDR